MDIDLTKIERQYDGGNGDMGTVVDMTSAARFGLKVPWLLLFVRVHFYAAAGETAAGVADLALARHKETVEPWQNFVMWTQRAVGFDNDANIRILEEEYPAWVFLGDEELVLTWTNPDADKLLWAVEVGVMPLVEMPNA